MCSTVSAQAKVEESGSRIIPENALEQCFSKSERLARLKCYDLLLERPQLLEEDTAAVETDQVERVAQLPPAISYANDLLISQHLIEDRVHITLRRADGGEYQEFIEFEGGDLKGFLDEPRSEEQAEQLRLDTDLFLAIESDTSIGEAATLILSCENNISRLKVVFHQPFDGRFVDARFYGSETLSDENSLSRKLWVRGDGYLLENARGLDSIKLIARLISGALSQVSVGNGENIRSAFFETEALTKALPYLARHCSWSSDVTR